VNEEIVAEQKLLLTFFHHHVWANKRLFDECLKLNEEQLNYVSAGTYGSIQATLAHLVRAEERYLFFLTGNEVTDRPKANPQMPVAELKTRIQKSGKILLEVATAVQPDTQVQVGEGQEAELIPAVVLLLQAVYHAHEHRAHIATLLGQMGLEPPGLSGWNFYDEEIVPDEQ
jgi:uncharacterized damage-inducible protein DinB